MQKAAEFACEWCGKMHAWSERVAGRRVRCGCGGMFVCPEKRPGEEVEAGEYEMGPEVGERGRPAAAPAQRGVIAPVRPVAPVVPVAQVAPVGREEGVAVEVEVEEPGARRARGRALEYRGAKKEGEKAEAEALKNFYMPMWLLGGGVVVEVAASFIAPSGLALRLAQRSRVQAALVDVGMDLIAGTLFMLAGMLLASKIRGIDLGKFWVAVFKLSAISVAPAVVVSMASPVLNMLPVIGGLIGWVGGFMLYFALIGALFDLDQEDTWFCVMVIFLIKVGMYFSVWFYVMR